MQISGTLQVRTTLGDSAMLERFDAEVARIQALSDQGLEALCTLIDAHAPIDVARRLYRFVAATASPGAVLGRMYEHDPAGFARFCPQLTAYRAYMERIASGVSPAEAAREAERVRFEWLDQALRARAATLDEDEDEEIDVYDAEGEIDPGAVRAEVDRLLRRLNVAPERVDVTILPDEGIAPSR